jgi:hypothetical protein
MMRRFNARAVLYGMAATLTLASAPTSLVKADIITTDPSLPPTSSTTGPPAYLTPAEVHAMYSGAGLTAVLSQAQHRGFNHIDRATSGADEHENFQSMLTGLVSINGGPNAPFTLNGPVGVTVLGKAGKVTGTFNTEMTSLDMTGTVGGHSVEVKLDPTSASTGQTTITDLGSGLFRVSSFFDVFTELSLDGGAFIPQVNGPSHVVLGSVPEPGTWIMYLTAGVIVPAAYARWRRRS